MMKQSARVIFIGMQPSKARFRRNCTLDRFGAWVDTLGLRFVSFHNAIIDPDLAQRPSSVDYDLLRESVHNYSYVVALGNLASTALKRIDVDHFKMPHPSPLNRLLNDRSYEQSMLYELRSYVYGG